MHSLVTRLLVIAASLVLLSGCTTPPAPTAKPTASSTPAAGETITLAQGCEAFGVAFEKYSTEVVDADGNTTLPSLSKGTRTLTTAAANIVPLLAPADSEAAAAFTKVVGTGADLIADLDASGATLETYDFESAIPTAYGTALQELTDVCVPE